MQSKYNLKELLNPYLKQWKWYIFSVVVAIGIAFLVIRYSTPKFAVQAKIQILTDQRTSSELSAFRDLEIYTGGNAQVEDELEILNSRANLIEVVKHLGINISIKSKGKIHDTEVYESVPFKINFLIPDSILFKAEKKFSIKIDSDTTFLYSDKDDLSKIRYSFGNRITSGIGDFVLIPNSTELSEILNQEFNVTISPVEKVALAYQKRIKVTITNKLSNIILIELEDAVEKKGIDIVNTLIQIYNDNDLEDKKLIAERTSEFINERITDIYGSLSNVDQSAEQFKSGRGITDVTSQSEINLSIGAQNQKELQDAQIQLNIASSMKDIVDNQIDYEILPANVGLSDANIANAVSRYNQLVLERNRYLRSSNVKNPIIVNLDQELEGLRRSLKSGLNSVTNNLSLQVNNLSSRLSQVNARIYAAPGNERALRDITRRQQTTESLYLYLLQKREESQISFASASRKSKIIDHAYGVSESPVSPKKEIIYLGYFILGFLVPSSVIYVKELLDNKVHNKVMLEKIVEPIPVLAELPVLSKKENFLVQPGERTVFAEALRILRTNLDYIIKSKSQKTEIKKDNVVFVTSSVPGEGKTLVSANLAMIFAKANKRVLLIGADIRNPKVYQFYSGKNVDRLGKNKRKSDVLGLTEYLSNVELSIEDIIVQMLAHDQTVDVIYSGKVPPNPAELLMSERMKGLLSYVSDKYDYVIVDTAPLIVVSDTLLISGLADHILYVVRAEKTELKVIDFPLKLHSEGKLNGLAFVVNGVKSTNLGYGGKYGYGYGEKSKKWWKLA